MLGISTQAEARKKKKSGKEIAKEEKKTESLTPYQKLFEGKKVEMVDCPLVEGAVVATIDSVGGMSFEDIRTALAGVGRAKKF